MSAVRVIGGLFALAVACPAGAILWAANRTVDAAHSDAGDGTDDGAVPVLTAVGTIVLSDLGPVGIPPLGQP